MRTVGWTQEAGAPQLERPRRPRARRCRARLLAKLRHVAQPMLHTERLSLVPLADEHLQFEIELDSDPEVMRYITGRALSQPRVAGEADLGYRVPRRHWRRGYASEGARELIRYGFEDAGLDRIFAQTMAVNAASQATMAAVGLIFSRAFVSGEPYDDLVPGAQQGEVEYEVTTTWQHRSG
jgi:RimJ/RimL family protein N-acetyltransferase